MGLFKTVNVAKFDIPVNSNINNINDFFASRNITAGRILKVKTVPRDDKMQSIYVFYINGKLDNLPIPPGLEGEPGVDGQQGPVGDTGVNAYTVEAVCVYFYR